MLPLLVLPSSHPAPPLATLQLLFSSPYYRLPTPHMLQCWRLPLLAEKPQKAHEYTLSLELFDKIAAGRHHIQPHWFDHSCQAFLFWVVAGTSRRCYHHHWSSPHCWLHCPFIQVCWANLSLTASACPKFLTGPVIESYYSYLDSIVHIVWICVS